MTALTSNLRTPSLPNCCAAAVRLRRNTAFRKLVRSVCEQSKTKLICELLPYTGIKPRKQTEKENRQLLRAEFQVLLEWIESLTETKKTQSKSLKITHLSKFQPLVLSNLSGIEANDLPPLATTGGSYGHGAESGSERIVIATAPRLQFGDNWLLRQALENQHQALQLRHGIGFPDKQIWMVLRYV